MSNKEWFLFVGVLVGAILWASVTTLVENNGLIAIIGLSASCLVMGVAMGVNIGGKRD
jgi:hypothetical protein